jgi:hypothetical protein
MRGIKKLRRKDVSRYKPVDLLASKGKIHSLFSYPELS